MAEQRVYQGHVYVRNAPGEPWALQGPAPEGVVIAADPVKAQQEARAQGSYQRDAVKDQMDIAQTQATLPYAATKAQADASKAQSDAEKARTEAAAAAAEQAGKANPQVAAAASKLGLDEVLAAIDRARKDVSGWSTGVGGQMLQNLGGTQARDLRGDLSTIGSHLTIDKLKDMKSQSSTGASGMGALSEKEGALLRDSVAGLDPLQSKDKVLESLAQVETHYRRLQAISHGENPDDPQVAKSYGLALGAPGTTDAGGSAPSDGGGSAPSGGTPASGGTITADGKFQADPALAGANAHVGTMIRAGKSPAEIRQYLDSLKPGLGAQAGGVDEAVAYARQHPEDKSDWLNLDLEKSWQPASDMSRALGTAGMSPLGSAAIGAADMLSMGTLDNMTDNPAMTRAVQGGLQQENPVAYSLGQVAGGALSGVGIEAGLARAGMSGIAASRVGDALLGAGYGAGSADEPTDSRISAALMGAGAGVAGGMAGRGAARLIGRGAQGAQGVAQRALHTAGVRMTPGQILGGGAKNFEDRLAGLPVVGTAINARRSEGVRDFNQAAFTQALDPINGQANGIAEPGMEAAQDAVSQGYRNALGGVSVQADRPFAQDVGALSQSVAQIPRVGPELHAAMTATAAPMFGAGGTLSGDAAQDIMQGMETIKRGYRGGAMTPADPLYATHIGPAVNSYVAALEDMVERQAPGTIGPLRAANMANRNVSTVGNAVMAAANQGGTFMPSQLMTASRANTKAFMGKRAAATGKGALFDLARAGQDVLPSKIPDSGTAGRMVLPLVVGGAAGVGGAATEDGSAGDRASTGLGTAAVAAALAAAPYSAPARATIQRLLLAERPQAVQDLGQIALGNQRIAGLLAAPSALLYAGE